MGRLMSTRKIWTSFHFLIILIILCCSVLGVHASYELETIYDGVTEYASEITHNGESVVKLLIPEGAKTSSGAIVRTPVNFPFNTLESFSNYISYYSARPRFLTYLDTTGNNEVDVVLMSDYQDFGDGEWTLATGGLRWGWVRANYPLPGWGGPWNPLIHWKNTFTNAQVLSLGVYLEYWGAHPEGLGEPLYVSNFIVTHTDSESISNTYLSLEPSFIEVPFLDSESANTFIEVAMKVYDISNLKELHVDFQYDENVLDYYSGKIDQTFYLTVGGGTGSVVDKRITKAFSGTITMYRYTFRVLSPGTTTISLQDTELLDEPGTSIPFTPIDCIVSVETLSDYMNNLYDELETSYNLMQSSYSALQFDYENLDSTYNSLQSENLILDEQYWILNTTFNELSSDYEILDTLHYELLDEYEGLEESLIILQSEFDILSNTFSDLNQDYLEIGQVLERTRSLFLLSATFALFFLILILAKRKHIVS